MSVAPSGQAYDQAVLSIPDNPRNAAAVTPSDSAALPNPAQALYVGGTGTVTVLTIGGQTTTFTVPAGVLVPIACSQIFATGTSATLIVALW